MTQIASTGQGKPKINHWSMENLLEKVKTVKQTCYEAIDKSGEIIKGRRIDYTLKQDYPDDLQNTYSIYNQSGYLEVGFSYNVDDSLVGKSSYKYDSNWNLVESNNYDSNDVLLTRSTYKYDDKGNEIEASSSFGSGVIYYKAINKYDDKGNQIETILFNIDGTRRKNTFQYDNKGNQVEMKRHESDGRYDSKLIYKYDDKGNMVESSAYNSNGSVLGNKQTSKYDPRGNLVEMSSLNPDGSYDYKWAYKYDERGNRIEWSWYKSDGRLDGKVFYNYTYDQKGNWIMKICHINNRPEYIYERELEYYE